MNKIALDREGKIYWNGKTLSFDALSKVMAQAHSLGPEPLTVFETEMGAPCKAVDAIRIEMERRLACGEDGPCFEGIMTVWRELPSPVGRPPS